MGNTSSTKECYRIVWVSISLLRLMGVKVFKEKIQNISLSHSFLYRSAFCKVLEICSIIHTLRTVSGLSIHFSEKFGYNVFLIFLFVTLIDSSHMLAKSCPQGSDGPVYIRIWEACEKNWENNPPLLGAATTVFFSLLGTIWVLIFCALR